MHSHHSHSGQFCSHAQNTLEQVIQTAISKQMSTFVLTEHMPRDQDCDVYPEEVCSVVETNGACLTCACSPWLA